MDICCFKVDNEAFVVNYIISEEYNFLQTIGKELKYRIKYRVERILFC